ncbi:MAG: FCSD flavin-binding domain-containing protein [Methylococcaceae bacterium]|nr:FCSD flavin-binding domain-containing protein [Methylococcaceae bacterium]
MTGITRRSFLALAGTAGALSLMGGCAATSTQSARRKVVVVGGGYGGATAAKYLKLFDPGLDVTLIEKRKTYYSGPGSNEVLAGWHELAWLRRSQEGLQKNHGVHLIHGKVTEIDPERRSVELKDGSEIPYDRLVLSPGVDMRFDAIEGYNLKASKRIPHAWRPGKQTLQLHNQIKAMRNGGVVVITAPSGPYRCPPGPYERASLIAHYLKQHKPRSKVIILDDKTQFSKQALFFKGWEELYPGMVEWVSSEKEGKIDHVDVKKLTVATEFNHHSADVLNIIPPQKAGWLARKAELADASGWCPVELHSFESTLIPNIHVIGDSCIATPMPKSAFSANSQAKICAHAIVELFKGNPPGPPSLINHCYSVLAPDYAISITGVYEYSVTERQLVATSSGETPMDADRQKEAEFARSWRENITADTFE